MTRHTRLEDDGHGMPEHVAVLTDSNSLLSIVFRVIEERGWSPHAISASDLERPDHVDWNLLVIGATASTMNPVQICAAASRHSRMSVLVTSPHRDAQFIADVLNAGADDYLAAPFDPMELDARMQGLISRKKAHEAAERRLG